MQDSNAPTKIPLPFGTGAGGGFINSIPTPSQIGIANGRASFTDGFPPLNFQPIAAGGVPPFGGDFNGLLLQITGGLQWVQAGGPIFYDATFQTTIGGYPKGAVVASVAYLGLWWYCEVDNNATNPDSGGANWLPMTSALAHGIQTYFTAGTFSFTVPSPILRIRVWGAGGGGGGSSGQPSCGASGGGGEYAEGLFTNLVPGTVEAITIGVGGTAGTSSPTSGGTGGTTSFGSVITALGGQGGLAESGGIQETVALGGTGGAGGQIRYKGSECLVGYIFSNGSATLMHSGFGGASWGFPAPPYVVQLTTTSVNGVPAQFTGNGGGTGINGANGAAGFPGGMIIDW